MTSMVPPLEAIQSPLKILPVQPACCKKSALVVAMVISNVFQNDGRLKVAQLFLIFQSWPTLAQLTVQPHLSAQDQHPWWGGAS
jgi:hypothetical protein